MSNYKGQLQEWCQKNRQPLPKYSDYSEGAAHQLEWTSECVMGNHRFTGNGPTKIESQQAASKIAFKFISSRSKSPPKKAVIKQPLPLAPSSFAGSFESDEDLEIDEGSSEDAESSEDDYSLAFSGPEVLGKGKRIVIIVDLENLPNFPMMIRDVCSPKTDLITVSSKHSAVKVPAFTKHYYTPSMRSDAADTCIIMLIGMFLQSEKYDEYFIATRDKFVVPVVDCVTSGTTPKLFEPKPIHIISQRDHLLEFLS